MQVNCVVNNAGLAIPVMPEDPSERAASFRKFLAVNLEGMSTALTAQYTCFAGCVDQERGFWLMQHSRWHQKSMG